MSLVLAVMLVLGVLGQGAPANARQIAAPAESGENGAEPETGEPWDGGMTTVEGDFFAITTEINGRTWALSASGFERVIELSPYDPKDLKQVWYEDENGNLMWGVNAIDPDKKAQLYLELYIRTRVYQGELEKAEINELWNAGEYGIGGDADNCDGTIPVALDEERGYLTINDYEGKLSAISLKVNDHVSVAVEESDLDSNYQAAVFERGGHLDLDVLEVSKTPSRNDELTFQKVPVTGQYPHFIDYKLEKDDWKITYNADGTYNVEINGRLNFPLRDFDLGYFAAYAYLECGEDVYGEVQLAAGDQEFTIRAESLPDDQEPFFTLIIWDTILYKDVSAAKDSGWGSDRVYDATFFVSIGRAFYEGTAAIPVRKGWADSKDHSGDSVDLSLVEDGRETSYKITLNEENGWEGVFKHVPYERWIYPLTMGGGGSVFNEHVPHENGTYPYSSPEPNSAADDPVSTADISGNAREDGRTPLDPRKYTIEETSGTPGYAPTYDFEGLTELTPGQPHSVQAVFPSADGSTLALTTSSEGVSEYVQGEPSQRLFLNGDHMLIAKLEEGSLPFASTEPWYSYLYFEEADAEGKYCFYMVDPYDGKLYFSLDEDEPLTTDKGKAVDFEFRDFETGETLKALPEDTFQPVKASLHAYVSYMDGQKSGLVFDLTYMGIYNALLVNKYDPRNPLQKFTICCCDGQLVAFCDEEDSFGICLLEPCEGASGQYLLRVLYYDPDTGKDLLRYLAYQEDIGTSFVDDKEAAMRFGLRNGSNPFEGTFTVTNTPLPASLEVSKTVSGGGADQNKEFAFTVTLSGDPISGVYGDMEFQNGVASFTLKHGERKTAGNLPAGVTYTVLETDNAGYTVTVNGSEAGDGKASGTLTGGETVTLAFNNDKPEPPTEPSKPSEPSDPSEPSEPSNPSEPSEPSKPTDPSEPSKPTDPKPTEPDAPKTGDETNMGLMLCVMGVSLVGIVLLAFLLLKNHYCRG